MSSSCLPELTINSSLKHIQITEAQLTSSVLPQLTVSSCNYLPPACLNKQVHRAAEKQDDRLSSDTDWDKDGYWMHLAIKCRLPRQFHYQDYRCKLWGMWLYLTYRHSQVSCGIYSFSSSQGCLSHINCLWILYPPLSILRSLHCVSKKVST